MMNVLPVLFKFFPKLESEYDCAVATGMRYLTLLQYLVDFYIA